VIVAESAVKRESGKAFSLTKPNAKTYVIVGGVAIVLGGLYLWWRKRQEAAAAASTTADTGSGDDTDYYPTPTGISSSQLLSWLSDHQASPTGKEAHTGGHHREKKPTPAKKPKPGEETPGKVTNLKAEAGKESETISWRPPQFGSSEALKPAKTTYSIRIVGKDKTAHDIGSRTSYNVAFHDLEDGKHYTAEVKANGGPTATIGFTTPSDKDKKDKKDTGDDKRKTKRTVSTRHQGRK
jgi:hypothetical protein